MSELSHRKARKLIQGNHLSSHERDALAAHLTECDVCRHYLAMHLHLSQELQLEPVRVRPVPELRAALRRRVHNQQRRNQIMKPIQVFAGVAALLILVTTGWMLFGNNPQQVEEPAAILEEATAAPTQETFAVVEPELPTETAAVLPTETAVPAAETPPTETPLPTSSLTLERTLITHPNDLIGTWHRDPSSVVEAIGYDLAEKVIRFYPGGTFAVANTLAELEAGDIQLAADYWFEDGMLQTQQPSIGQEYWTANGCLRSSGKWGKSRFEVAVKDEQTLEFVMLSGGCQSQRDWIVGVYTPTTADTIDLHIDPDSGLVINPDSVPGNASFIVEGTLIDVDLTSSDAPQLVVRLPSGETVLIASQPIDQVLDSAGINVDLTTYEYDVSPPNPLRIRATVQEQDDGVLVSDSLTVLAVED